MKAFQLNRILNSPPVLESFIVGVQNALKRNLVGAYLIGSLATGDFDLDSDIDFLIVTDAELSDAELRLLQALHIEIHNLDCYPAKHLEGYISRGVLIRADLVGVQPLWYVDNGSSLLQRSVHDNRWHVRWVLRPEPTRFARFRPVASMRHCSQGSKIGSGGYAKSRTPNSNFTLRQPILVSSTTRRSFEVGN